MASTERSTDIAKPPEEVFPYLFEADKVPQWTTGLHSYERLDGGALARVEVPGEPRGVRSEDRRRPRDHGVRPAASAEARTEIRGVDVASHLRARAERAGGTRLTQTVEASGGGLEGARADPDDPAVPRAEDRGGPRGLGRAARLIAQPRAATPVL